jgi:ABC-type multidrug transport system fused ATPase/permease subunit
VTWARPKDRDIAMVFQNYALYPYLNVKDNIAFGLRARKFAEPEVEKRVGRAAEMLGIAHLLARFPRELSGGQRQRVAIARALLMDPRILILDDSTSSVDTETELLIQKALDELMVGRTTFVIAHRLATVRRADLILVMKDGRIHERGAHAALLRQGGLYKEIYDLQLREQEAIPA